MIDLSPMAGKTIDGTSDVNQFMSNLAHPLHAEFEALRAIFLAADERILEGIKWKAPSFFYVDWFATFNLRATEEVQIILHTGAKVKASSIDGVPIDDPDGLLKWLAKDRCLLTLSGMADVESKRQAVSAIVKQWVDQM